MKFKTQVPKVAWDQEQMPCEGAQEPFRGGENVPCPDYSATSKACFVKTHRTTLKVDKMGVFLYEHYLNKRDSKCFQEENFFQCL